MIKRISIVGLFALLLVFTGCEKCDKPHQMDDPFVNASDRSAQDNKDWNDGGGRSTDNTLIDPNGPASADGDITDPNEDEDFDGIVDPDEDEDFDADGK